MAFARTDPQSRNADIWLYEFEHGVATRFTFDPGTDQTPVWSPDGRSIAFSAQRSGAWGLYRKASNLAGGEELLYRFDDERVPQPTSWSRDGRFLMFHTAGSVEWVLEVGAGASGKRKPFLLPVGSTGVGGRFSPDGRYFSYISRESGTQEIYVQSFDFESSTGPRAGGKWMVSKGGGLSAHWRADGRELFYMAPNGDIMAVDVSTTPTFHAGSPRRLFNPHAASRFWDSTGDGQRFLHPVALTENAPAPYTVVVNWLGLLRK